MDWRKELVDFYFDTRIPRRNKDVPKELEAHAIRMFNDDVKAYLSKESKRQIKSKKIFSVYIKDNINTKRGDYQLSIDIVSALEISDRLKHFLVPHLSSYLEEKRRNR